MIAKRFAKYGLTLHPEKTRLVRFPKPRMTTEENARPETFDLLGFTHHWGRSRRGALVVRRRTMRARLRRAIGAAHEWCRDHRHWRVSDQQRALSLKLRGHYQYYGVTGNWAQLRNFYEAVKRIWRTWLDRRSRHARMRWKRFNDLLKRHPLARPRVVHSTYRRAANP